MWLAARRADLRLRLAEYWRARGDLDEAARQAERALRPGSTVPDLLGARATLTAAEIASDRGEYASAHAHFDRAIDELDALPATGARDRLLTRALIGLGNSHRRAARYPDAVRTLHRAVELAEAADPSLLAAALTGLGITHKELGEFDPAAGCYERVRRLQLDSAPAPAAEAGLQHNLAGLAHAREDYERAEAHARLAVALRERSRGAPPVDVAADLAVLGAALAAQDKHAEALAELTRAVDICRAAKPPREYELAVQRHNIAAVLQSRGDLQPAEDLYRMALAAKARLLGDGHPELAVIANNLGTLLLERGRAVEADEHFRWALSIAERALPADHPVTAAIRHNLR